MELLKLRRFFRGSVYFESVIEGWVQVLKSIKNISNLLLKGRSKC